MKVTVGLVGATGETGSSIVNGLLESTSPRFEITALTRPSSLQKPKVLELEERGVRIVAVDIEGSLEELTKLLTGLDVVISTVDVPNFLAQIPLANAAKAAGVKRFIPCFFATVVPPKGILAIRDTKEDVLNHIKKIYLPYTVIDVGWWYQLSLPHLPSGRIDHAIKTTSDAIAGDGSVKSGLTDLRDVGRYVARIIVDPRTLNHSVFAYNELLSQTEVYEALEKISGETIERKYISEETIVAAISDGLVKSTTDRSAFFPLIANQYLHSRAIRGDNTPDHARYLGYLVAKDLYPDFQGGSFLQYIQDVLDGRVKGVYEGRLPKAKTNRD